MNPKRLCQIVDKYEKLLTEDTLIDKSLYGDKITRYCILGACLHEAGIPDDALLDWHKQGSNVLWRIFGNELVSQGVESEEDTATLMSLNDETQYEEGTEDEDGRELTVPEKLRQFLACS